MSLNGYSHALVTGGAGFIGSHLARALLARGMKVTVLDNLSTGTRAAVDTRVRFIEGDIRSRGDVEQALEGVDCVFHLAAKVSVRGSFENFYDDVETNILGTSNIIRCLKNTDVRHFILASSMAVYADADNTSGPVDESHPCRPISPYGVGKMCDELLCGQMLDQLGIAFTAFRYFNTYGQGQQFTPYVGVITIFVTRLLEGKSPVVFGDGMQQRDFVHVDDIAAGTVAALEGPAGIYNLGTGVSTTVLDLAKLLVERINPGIEIAFAAEQPGELRNSVANIDAARTRLGYEPQRILDQDIGPVIDYIRGLKR